MDHPVDKHNHTEANLFVQNNAPGYQIDYYQIDLANDPKMTLDDCRLYGLESVALQICLKKVDTSLMAGGFSTLSSLLTISVEFLPYVGPRSE